MDRLESAVWSLAGGALCGFVLAVVLKDAHWWVGCVVVAVSVACWALRTPPLTGTAVGLIGWLFVTGFDVSKNGDLTFRGTSDLVRFCVLVGVGLTASLIGRLFAAPARDVPMVSRRLRADVRDESVH